MRALTSKNVDTCKRQLTLSLYLGVKRPGVQISPARHEKARSEDFSSGLAFPVSGEDANRDANSGSSPAHFTPEGAPMTTTEPSTAELAELAADIADLTERVGQLESDVAAIVAAEASEAATS